MMDNGTNPTENCAGYKILERDLRRLEKAVHKRIDRVETDNKETKLMVHETFKNLDALIQEQTQNQSNVFQDISRELGEISGAQRTAKWAISLAAGASATTLAAVLAIVFK